MQTYTLKVDPDGRVTIPDTRPGHTVTVRIEPPRTEILTLGNARTDEERDQVIEEMLALAAQLREELKDELPIDQNELYDEDGLPA